MTTSQNIFANQQNGNVVYMVRGPKIEGSSGNGQHIIIQNTQDLINLLNKSNSRIVEKPNDDVGATTTTTIVKSSQAPDGKIQQKNISVINNAHLLIKSVDKAQSFLVIRNATPNSTVTLSEAKGSKDDTKVEKQKVTSVDGEKNIHIGSDGEPIKLPENLEGLPRADHLPSQRHRWNTNEEIAAILINFSKHPEWQSKEVKTRPKSGSMILYSRKKVRYRRDGYCWKKRKDGKTTREDHMKLKVQGTECIYGCYVHSALLPTFHRRCYWLLQNPDIVLVHYLNVPYPNDDRTQHNKMVIAPSIALWNDKKEWTKEELLNQLKPMFFSEDDSEVSRDIELSLMHSQTSDTVETIVCQLMEKQRHARQAALVKQLDQSCPDSSCALDRKPYAMNVRRSGNQKNHTETVKNNNDNINQVQTTNYMIDSKQPYPRWYTDRQINLEMVQRKQQFTKCDDKSVNAYQSATNNNSRSHQETQIQSPLINNRNNNNNSSNIYSLQSTINSKQNNNISHNPIANDGSVMQTQHRATLKNDGITNLSDNKDQLAINSNQNTIMTNLLNSHANNSNSNCEKMKNDSSVNYHNNNNNNNNKQQQPQHISSSMSPSCNKDTDIHNLTNEMQNSSRDMSKDEMEKENSVKIEYLTQEMCDKKEENNFAFNTTLDLSQEDIQQTLKANLQLNYTYKNEDSIVHDINNTLGFIDDCTSSVIVHEEEDDAFVNLDAFDMLSELPELELDSVKNHIVPKNDNFDDGNMQVSSYMITEFCPEWSFCEGGIKILITGPWTFDSAYTVYFDNVSVPATIVQNGVLRTFAPKHEQGMCKLCVSDGISVSNSVDFEYKSQTKCGFGYNEVFYKFGLMNKLETIDSKNGIKTEPCEEMSLFNDQNFEDRLVSYCKRMSCKKWENSYTTDGKCNNLTILHFVAMLGYSKLAKFLWQWKSNNTCPLLETEVNPMAQSSFDGNTPLHAACENKFEELSIYLYKLNQNAANLKNYRNMTVKDICTGNGLHQLMNAINTEKSNEIIEYDKKDDQIFLRPDAIMSTSSSPNSRINKRSSIDFNQYHGGMCQKESQKSRSMSLPVTYLDSNYSLELDNIFSSDQDSSSNSSSILSPLRKIDFAFCEVSRSRSILETDQTHQSSCSLSEDDEVKDITMNDVNISSSETVGETDKKVLNLAEKIIAAMPRRIKNETDESMPLDEEIVSNDTNEISALMTDSFMESNFDHEFNFEFNNYRYDENCSTPCSSLSPASSGPLQSPASYFQPEPPRSPPVTVSEFNEFFEASSSSVSQAFDTLTLSENEQKELYEAAKCIQNAYRTYKGRKKMEEQDKRGAATVIQNYYRRYKEYAYYREMTHAALVIQNKYRSYCENKRFKKSQMNGNDTRASSESVRRFKSHDLSSTNISELSTKEPQIMSGLKRTYSQRTQHDAARKIQQFMRKSKIKLQKEREEKEKQAIKCPAPLSQTSFVFQGHQHSDLFSDQT